MKTTILTLTTILGLSTLGCGGDEPASPPDPIGTWDMVWTFGEGDCDLAGTEPFVWVVQRDAAGKLTVKLDDDTLTGKASCDSSGCLLSTESTFSVTANAGGKAKATTGAAIIAAPDGKISGGGALAIEGSDGSACSQAFTVAGTKR